MTQYHELQVKWNIVRESTLYYDCTISPLKGWFPLHRQKHASCSKSATGLLPYSHQADIRMSSHCLLRLDDNKSAASCQQAWCKLIVKIFYPQAWCKLFRKLAASLQISSCNKSDFHRLAATSWSQRTCCIYLITNVQQAGKIHNLLQVWAFPVV